MSIFYGVGVGPGDPELLTLKAINTIRSCDALVIPVSNPSQSVAYNILKAAIPEAEQMQKICINMPMTKDADILHASHISNSGIIANHLNQGENVAFITLGDPTVYSTFSHLQDILSKEGFETKIINGIPSFTCAASLINRSLVEKDESLHIIPASYDINDSLSLSGTKVYMKPGKNLNAIKAALKGTNKKVFIVGNLGMENEFFLEGVDNIPDHVGYFTILIVFD